MNFEDLYPVQGMFLPGELIHLIAEVGATEASNAAIHLTIFHLADEVETIEFPISLEESTKAFSLSFQLPLTVPRGYGAKAELTNEKGEVVNSASTAFDVLESWIDFPRYGFLTDFSPGRQDIEETVNNLARYHINGLQFYDWQYRHDHMLPPSEMYIDPLGRELSLDTVRRFINEAHKHNIAAMPYLAVYAASLDFWSAHESWRLFDKSAQPILFEDFLGIMDPSPGSPWADHLLDECDRTLSALPFDGLHIDQYGDPKEGFNHRGEEVDIPAAFHHFIAAAKRQLPESAVTFNAVGNWPIGALTSAPQDFIYIEIWPLTPFYRDLREVISNARKASGGKPVVVALYLPATQIENIRLADALIFASGGCRIELGEQGRLLTDPYFPKHQPIFPDLALILRRYYDFAVRFSELLGPSAKDLKSDQVISSEGVWHVVREGAGRVAVHLLNMNGLGDPRWDEPQPSPNPFEDLLLQLPMLGSVRQVFWASPDRDCTDLTPANWSIETGRLHVSLPFLDYWTMVVVETD